MVLAATAFNDLSPGMWRWQELPTVNAGDLQKALLGVARRAQDDGRDMVINCGRLFIRAGYWLFKTSVRAEWVVPGDLQATNRSMWWPAMVSPLLSQYQVRWAEDGKGSKRGGVSPEILCRKTSSMILSQLKQTFIKTLYMDQDGIWAGPLFETFGLSGPKTLILRAYIDKTHRSPHFPTRLLVSTGSPVMWYPLPVQ